MSKRTRRKRGVTLRKLIDQLIGLLASGVPPDTQVVVSALDVPCNNDIDNRPVVDAHSVGHGADQEVWVVYDEAAIPK